jgi:hypothetical protein
MPLTCPGLGAGAEAGVQRRDILGDIRVVEQAERQVPQMTVHQMHAERTDGSSILNLSNPITANTTGFRRCSPMIAPLVMLTNGTGAVIRDKTSQTSVKIIETSVSSS